MESQLCLFLSYLFDSLHHSNSFTSTRRSKDQIWSGFWWPHENLLYSSLLFWVCFKFLIIESKNNAQINAQINAQVINRICSMLNFLVDVQNSPAVVFRLYLLIIQKALATLRVVFLPSMLRQLLRHWKIRNAELQQESHYHEYWETWTCSSCNQL